MRLQGKNLTTKHPERSGDRRQRLVGSDLPLRFGWAGQSAVINDFCKSMRAVYDTRAQFIAGNLCLRRREACIDRFARMHCGEIRKTVAMYPLKCNRLQTGTFDLDRQNGMEHRYTSDIVNKRDTQFFLGMEVTVVSVGIGWVVHFLQDRLVSIPM